MNHSALGNAIADDIERLGHAQDSTTAVCPSNKECCVLTSPAYGAEALEPASEKAFLDALTRQGGKDHIDARVNTMEWNDNTPTAVVLASLRSL